jgi:polyphosphate kinase 2 (PPK2 family)
MERVLILGGIGRLARVGEKKKQEGTGKFFPHMRADGQLRRFKQRIDEPACHRKISESEAHSQ